MKFIDMANNIYGDLKVISRVDNNKWNKPVWLCECSCGSFKEVAGESLRKGATNSCGHRQFELNRILAIYKFKYAKLKTRHNKFTKNKMIGFDDFIKLSDSKCEYCDAEYSMEVKDIMSKKTKKLISLQTIKINGLDRIDNKDGYVKGNCVPCCATCNMAKSTMDLDEFKEWIIRIYRKSITT